MMFYFISSTILLLCEILRHVAAQSAEDRVMRVDDSNVYSSSNPTGIQYSFGWEHSSGNAAKDRYRDTLSTSQTDNTTAIYFFKGSSIAYYADPVPSGTYAFASLDGLAEEPLSPGTSGGSKQLLWSRSNLDEGDHQLVIRRDNGSGVLTIDYFEVTYREDARPSLQGPGAIDAPLELINFVDDDDSRITYKGNWEPWVALKRGFYYGGRQRTSNTTGSSLAFSFSGNSVWYFSDKHRAYGEVLISVDGGEGDIVETGLEEWDDRWFSQVLCWSKKDLTDGPHMVNITHLNGWHANIDFFAYASIPNSHKGNTVPLGAVIGGAVGGVAVFVVVALVLYWLRRRRQVQQAVQQEGFSASESTKYESTIGQTGGPVMHNLPYQCEQWHRDSLSTGQKDNGLPTTGTSQWGAQHYSGFPEPHNPTRI